MAELLLYVTFVDFGRGRETCAQRMAREFVGPLGFVDVASNAGRKCRLLDQTDDRAVIQLIRADLFALTSD